MAIQEKREENKLDDYEKDKIIDLDRDVILKKLELLPNIKDKLIFAVYTLQPARRLDWRHVVSFLQSLHRVCTSSNRAWA
jgi:hypothetical protein